MIQLQEISALIHMTLIGQFNLLDLDADDVTSLGLLNVHRAGNGVVVGSGVGVLIFDCGIGGLASGQQAAPSIIGLEPDDRAAGDGQNGIHVVGQVGHAALLGDKVVGGGVDLEYVEAVHVPLHDIVQCVSDQVCRDIGAAIVNVRGLVGNDGFSGTVLGDRDSLVTDGQDHLDTATLGGHCSGGAVPSDVVKT